MALEETPADAALGETERGVEAEAARSEEESDVSKVTPSDGENFIAYRTEYINNNSDTIIGSVVSSSRTYAAPSSYSSDVTVLEVLTTVVVIKASPVFFDNFKDENRIDARKRKDFVLDGLEIGHVEKVEMLIYSQPLIDALRAIIEYYPGSTLFTDPVKISEPFVEILHYRDEIEAYKDQHPTTHDLEYVETTNKHIDVLLSFVDQRFGDDLEAERQRHRKNPPTCTFQMLWLLYRPGELCYFYPAPGQLQAVIAKNFHIPLKRTKPMHLFGWSIAFDGKMFGREPFDKSIASFVGEKDISTLDCFPAKFFKGSEEDKARAREKLIARGHKYWKTCKPTYCDYRGTAANFPYRQINGRIMVDSLSCFEANAYEAYDNPSDLDKPVLLHSDADKLYKMPRYKNAQDYVLDGTALDDMARQNLGCNCPKCVGNHSEQKRGAGRFWGYDEYDPEQSPPPNMDEYLLLCSYRTFVFDLSARRWEVVNIENVNTSVQASNVFADLVLPKEIRQTVYALAKAYEKQGPSKKLATDIIKGKGLGTIFLLHGPPGVGKTATAESVAELTNRPLLSLTCGDLGTDGAEVETSLDQYLGWGLAWGAVVLLDEADVFLEQRDIADVGRNSLVSVFLRALEYYSGFLFLTTNRVNTFDEAFISRIHVALHYKPLGPEERSKIWANNIKRLENNGVKVMQSTKDYIEDEVVELDWNGREIRNAFQTATALAQYDADTNGEAITLRLSHIRRVVGLSSQFHRYLASISRGMTPAELALKRGLRNDLVDAPPKRDAKAQRPSRRHAKYYENDEDEDQDIDDRKARKSQNTNPRSLPLRFHDDEDEEEGMRNASASKRNMRTPDSDEEVEMERAQKSKASAQRRERLEDKGDADQQDVRRRTERRLPKVTGTKALNYEDHESDDDEEEEEEVREPLREAKSRRP